MVATKRESQVKRHKALQAASPFMITQVEKIASLVQSSWAEGRIRPGDMLLVTDPGVLTINSSQSGKGYLIPYTEIDVEAGKCRSVPLGIHFYPEKLLDLDVIEVDGEGASLIAAGQWGKADSAINSNDQVE